MPHPDPLLRAPVPIRDRTGRPLWLRRATEADVEGLTGLQRALAEDGRGMVLGPAEVDAGRHRTEVLSAVARADDDAILVVIADDDGGGIVATGEASRLRPSALHHVALLTLGVHPRAQGRGLGRAMMEALVAWGDAAGVRRLELYTRADNHRARRLYRNLGFVVQGVRPDFVRTGPHTFVDDLVMGRAAPTACGTPGPTGPC